MDSDGLKLLLVTAALVKQNNDLKECVKAANTSNTTNEVKTDTK